MDMYGSKKKGGKKTSSCSAKPGMPKGGKGNGGKKGMK